MKSQFVTSPPTHQSLHFSAPTSMSSQKVAELCSKVRLAFRRIRAAIFLSILRINLRVGQQVVLNELPSLGRVFAHVEREELRDDFELADFHRGQADCVRRNELLELAGVDFTQSFESAGFA